MPAGRLLSTAALAAVVTASRAQAAALVVVQAGDERAAAVAGLLARELPAEALSRVEFTETQADDPIARGRLLASLTAASLVVPVGDGASGLVAQELDGPRVIFVGPTLLAGQVLALPRVAGVLGFSAEDALGGMPKAWRSAVGLLYSPGYEPVVERVRAAAAAAGVTIVPRAVSSAKALPSVARRLLPEVKALWVLGEPALFRGAAFEFLVEETLSRDVAFVAADCAAVGRGAVYCSRGKPEELARRAARVIASRSGDGAVEPRLQLAGPGGRLIYDERLAARYRLAVSGPLWSPRR